MTYVPTKRYCADPAALSAMARDGMGWGHDLDCGCFHAPAVPRKLGAFATLFQRKRGV